MPQECSVFEGFDPIIVLDNAMNYIKLHYHSMALENIVVAHLEQWDKMTRIDRWKVTVYWREI
jgi:hypothetical protein